MQRLKEEISEMLKQDQCISNFVLFEDLGDEGDKNSTLYIVASSRKRIEIVPSLGEYGIYDRFVYKSMSNDPARKFGYLNGLADKVRDKNVLIPGVGADLILAQYCIAAGARKVYAVEKDFDAFHQAQKLNAKLQLSDKLIIVYGDASSFKFADDIDYVVSALAGNIASSDGCINIINSLRSASTKNLEFIPNRYTTKIAAVNLSAGSYDQLFSQVASYYVDRVFQKFNSSFDLRICLKHMGPEIIISNHGIVEDIIYNRFNPIEDQRDVVLEITQNSFITGVILWINAFSDDFLMIDSLQLTHHLPVYFPLFDEPVSVCKGTKVKLKFEREIVSNKLLPDYKISVNIRRDNNQTISSKYVSPYINPIFRGGTIYNELFNEDGTITTSEPIDKSEIFDVLTRDLFDDQIKVKLIKVDNNSDIFTDRGPLTLESIKARNYINY